MATIIQIPEALSIVGNIPDIILDSAETVNFKILLGAEVMLEENYDPDAADKINIRLRDILPTLLAISIPTSNVFEQTAAVKTFTFDIDGVTSNHVVVAGGVDATVDPAIFLKANWLTWQLQQKRVKFLDPEYLSYYATEATVVKLKAYFATGDPETITLTNLTSGKFYSLNTNFQYLSGLFETRPVYFDIWTESATAVRLSFIQRYVLQNDYYDSEDIFVFKNSLGGIDTIRFTGEKEEDNKFDISSALFDEDTTDYDIDFNQVFTKNSGYFGEDRERVWAQEFFNSNGRYLVTADGLKMVTVSSPVAKHNASDNTAIDYEFKFALSRQTKYLNFARADELPEDVEIIDPETEVFFLAPRLVEFPAATLDDLLLFPVQMPFTQEWRTLSYAAIRENFLQELANIGAFESAWGSISGDIADQADLVEALAGKADLIDGKVPLDQLPSGLGMTEHALTDSIHTEAGLTAGHFLKAISETAFGFSALTGDEIKALLTDVMEVIPNSGNPYLNIKLPTAFNYGVKVYNDNGQFPSSVWEAMPVASDSVKGGIKVGEGLAIEDGVLRVDGTFASAWGTISGDIADQTDLVAAFAATGHNHDSVYATIASVAALEAIMSTDTERIAAMAELAAAYTTADTALNDTVTAALVNKLPTSHLSDFVHGNIAHGETAFGWGNHAAAGYAPKENPVFTGKVENEVPHSYNADDEMRIGSYYGGNFYGIGFYYWVDGTGTPHMYVSHYAGARTDVMTVDSAGVLMGGYLKATSLKTATFSIEEDGADLVIKKSGTIVFRLSAAGGVLAKAGIATYQAI